MPDTRTAVQASDFSKRVGRRDNRGRRDRREDDDDEGGILGGLGDIVGKIFGG